MSREVIPGVHWIQECGPNITAIADTLSQKEQDWYQGGREIHIPQNAFLLSGQKTLLFDTLSPMSREGIIDEMRKTLGDRQLDYLVVSHTDTPHAGNTLRILEEYPDTALVAPAFGDTHGLYHLEDALKVRPEEEIDLGGLVVRFHEATFLDAPISIWMTEEKSNMLFPVDWLGMPHMERECLKFVDEIKADLTVDRLVEFHARVFFWLQYVDVEKVLTIIDQITEKLQPEILAPSHGLIIRENAVEAMLMMKEVVREIDRSGRLGVVG